MLTATPHNGDAENFSLFLQLLYRDAYADVKPIREAITRRIAPFDLRPRKRWCIFLSVRPTALGWRESFSRSAILEPRISPSMAASSICPATSLPLWISIL